MAKEIALKHLPPPGENAATCGPGPFALASEETDRAMLKAAGFENIELFLFWPGVIGNGVVKVAKKSIDRSSDNEYTATILVVEWLRICHCPPIRMGC